MQCAPKTCSSRPRNPALIPTLTIRLSDKCNLCSRLVDCWFGRMQWCVCVCVGRGGRSSCPCHATEVSSSGAYARTAAALSVPAACFMLQRRKGKSNRWFCSSGKRFSFPVTFSPNRQSLRIEQLPGGHQWKYTSSTIAASSCCCSPLLCLMNQSVRGKYS